MTEIGYQSGIAAACNALRKHFPENKAAWDKLERTLKILADDHDASIADDPDDPPPPPPPPPTKRLAPMTHYTTARADARYCVHSPGVTQAGPDDYVDEGGFHYTENGLCQGGRSGKFVAELKPADSMDGLEPCDGYTKDGQVFPPWPAASYDQ